MSAEVELYGKYGNARAQASRADDRLRRQVREANGRASGLTEKQVLALRERMESIQPKLTKSKPRANSLVGQLAEIAEREGVLSKRAVHGPDYYDEEDEYEGRRRAQSLGTSLYSPQRPYNAGREDGARSLYPRSRVLVNELARMFAQDDPVTANGVDLHSSMWCSDFDLEGENVDGEIKQSCERSIEKTRLKSRLPTFEKERLVTGEAAIHCHLDASEGIWTHITVHNTDHLEVLQSTTIDMEPIVELEPDPILKMMCLKDHPLIKEVRNMIPKELVEKVRSGEPIFLRAPNFTLVQRKSHPYDLRGTTLLTRLFRALLLEDSVFNAAIQTARRQAGPLKVVKLGDPNTLTVPTPDQEQRIQQLIQEQENDPLGWLTWWWGISFELVGINERMIPLPTFYPLIEGIKLMALGLTRAVVSGEASYNSAAAGLTILLQRWNNIRTLWENDWIIPRFLTPLAVMNEWIRRTPAEMAHRVRVKRTAQELLDRGDYIIPKIKWHKSLDANVDKDRIDAINAIEGGPLGAVLRFPRSMKAQAAGKSYESVLRQHAADRDMEREIIGKDVELALRAGVQLPGMPDPTAAGGGGGGGGLALSPGAPPGTFPELPPLPGEPLPGALPGAPPGELPPPAPASGEKSGGPNATRPDTPNVKPEGNAPLSSFGGWDRAALEAAIRLWTTFNPADADGVEPWDRILEAPPVQRALETGDADILWETVQEHLLEEEHYPVAAVLALEKTLDRARQTTRIGSETKEELAAIERLGKLIDEADEVAGVDFLGGAPSKKPPRLF